MYGYESITGLVEIIDRPTADRWIETLEASGYRLQEQGDHALVLLNDVYVGTLTAL